MKAILLDNVKKVYHGRRGEVAALDGVSLSVERGEFVAIQGPSGSGKSTLLLLCGAMLRPTSGAVAVLEQKIGALSSAERARFRARNVGFVFQLFHLAPYLTVLENTLLSNGAGTGRQRRAEATALLERLGLGDRVRHKPAELSAGERQRTAMARALIGRPPLILADEPTGNLDPQNASQIIDILAEYHQQGGTVLLVTHQPGVSERAQRVIRLERGKIAG
ncbi:MAG: ABC transporter ATP-binding protein [Candidatus Sumerlaeota bacterium]|nr:ABC transporter ATP-binding protein [Candidatus Sumerlaeota bacterium]